MEAGNCNELEGKETEKYRFGMEIFEIFGNFEIDFGISLLNFSEQLSMIAFEVTLQGHSFSTYAKFS